MRKHVKPIQHSKCAFIPFNPTLQLYHVRPSTHGREYRSPNHTMSTSSSNLYCEQQSPKAKALRDLYTITNSPDIQRARTTAQASVANLSNYLSQRPLADHTRDAFKRAMKWVARPDSVGSLCLDSGCGSGRSTLNLANHHSNCDILGIDKSEVRLTRNQVFRKHDGQSEQVDNALLLRADLVDFWTLCFQHQVFPTYHYILYPNPYPKITQLKVCEYR